MFEVARKDRAAIEAVLSGTGVAVTTRSVARAGNPEGTLDTKVRYELDVISQAKLPPRRVSQIDVEVPSVDKALAQIRSSVGELGARETGYSISKDPNGYASGGVTIEVPMAKSLDMHARIRALDGEQKGDQVTENQQVSAGSLAREQIQLTFHTGKALVAADKGIGPTVRNALASALGALLWSLYWIIMGIVFVGPFAAVLWIGSKIWRRKPKTA